MYTLILKVSTTNCNSIGISPTWDDLNLEFKTHRDLGIFDNVQCNLKDNLQGELVISAWNNNNREISGEYGFVELEFDYKDPSKAKDVEFGFSFASAQDAAGTEKEVQVITRKLDITEPVEPPTVFEYIWK